MGYKMKSHSGAKKRFKITKNGKVKHGRANTSHILTKMPSKRKRHLRKQKVANATVERRVKALLPYSK